MKTKTGNRVPVRPIVRIHAEESEHLKQALAQFAEVMQRSPLAVEEFLDSGDPLVRVAHIRPESAAAERAGDVLLLFEPSDGLLKFLSAMGAGNVDHA